MVSIASGTFYAKATLNGGVTINSSSVTIGTKTGNVPVITTATIYEGDNSITGTGTEGDVISLYVGGAFTERTTTVSGGNWTFSSIPTYELYIGADVYVTATSSGKCEGNASSSKVVQCVVPTTPSYTGGNFNYCTGGAGSISLPTSQTGVIYQLVNNSGVAVGPASIGTGSGITLYTNVLNSDLSNIYVKAYKIGYSSCSATALTVINFTNEYPSPIVTFATTSLSVQKGTLSVNLHIDSKSITPSADTYTIDYSVSANGQGFSDTTVETAIPAAGSDIVLTVPGNPATGTYMGTLRVKETAGSSCYKYYDFTITVYAADTPPTIGVQPSNSTICYNTPASLSVTSYSATAMTYQWQKATSYSGTFSNVTGGSGGTSSSCTTENLTSTSYYKVIVSNSTGSTTSNIVTVTVTSLPSAAGAITGSSPVCAGQSSVGYSVSSISGATSYTWAYSGSNATISGSTNSVSVNFASNATSGDLTVTGTNLCGSGNTATKTITVNPTPFINNITKNSCSGVAFSVTPANVTNGIVPGATTYSWPAPVVTGGMTGGATGSGSSISGTLINSTGTTQTAAYTVTPTAGSCPGSTFTLTVSVYPQISLTATPVAVLCNGGSTGSINLSVSYGTPPLTYLWSDGPTTGNRSLLAAGTYSVTLTDNNLCSANASATVTQPIATTISSTIGDVTCYGGNTGSITIDVSGGTGTKTYLWNDGSASQNRTAMAAGTYSVTITDDIGCKNTFSGIVISQPTDITASAPFSAISCNGGTSTITVSASGGTGTFSYSINSGSYQPGNTFNVASSVTPHIITVKDAANCTKNVSVTITQPTAIVLSTTAVQPTCPPTATLNNKDGSIDLSVSGGTPGYTYSWATLTGIIPAGEEIKQDPTGLTAGTYSVTVTDANLCTAGTSATLNYQKPKPVTPGTITK